MKAVDIVQFVPELDDEASRRAWCHARLGLSTLVARIDATHDERAQPAELLRSGLVELIPVAAMGDVAARLAILPDVARLPATYHSLRRCAAELALLPFDWPLLVRAEQVKSAVIAADILAAEAFPDRFAWAPRDEHTRRRLNELSLRGRIFEDDLPPLLDVDGPPIAHALVQRRLQIGIDTLGAQPTPVEWRILEACARAGLHVRLRLSADECAVPPSFSPGELTTYAPRDVSRGRFARMLDVVLDLRQPREGGLRDATFEIVSRGVIPALSLEQESFSTASAIFVDPERFDPAVLRCVLGEADAGDRLSSQACATARHSMGEAAYRGWLAKALPGGALAQSVSSGGPLESPPAPTISRSSPRSVAFMTSNGVGLGHVQRLLAVARALRDEARIVFLSLSQGIQPIIDCGLHVEFLQSAESCDADPASWNAFLSEEVEAVLRCHSVDVLVFDGNNLYPGLRTVIGRNERLAFVWMRRGLWQRGKGEDQLPWQRLCDLVIEPGDLASSFDEGATGRQAARAPQPLGFATVGPITRYAVETPFSREEARRRLGLGRGPHILIQLGAGALGDLHASIDAVLAVVRKVRGLTPVLAQWPIAERPLDCFADVRTIDIFPLSPYFAAFDLSISATGYNSFHETLAAGLPTIFMPSRHHRLDDQDARARYAHEAGLAARVLPDEPDDLEARIRELLDPARAQHLRTRARRACKGDGAYEAARLILEYARAHGVHPAAPECRA